MRVRPIHPYNFLKEFHVLFEPPVLNASQYISYNQKESQVNRVQIIHSGIGFGSALAIVISYAHNHSILWAIVQGLFSWFYVLYAALVY